jgi:hypothetical protein
VAPPAAPAAKRAKKALQPRQQQQQGHTLQWWAQERGIRALVLSQEREGMSHVCKVRGY